MFGTRIMNGILHIHTFVKPKAMELHTKFFHLEQLCFSSRYRMAPKTKSEFDGMFSTEAHVTCAAIGNEIVGMAFLDTISSSLCYLRVICVHPSYRRQGIAIRIAREILEQCQPTLVRNIAFVSESMWVERIMQEAGFVITSPLSQKIPEDLLGYNPALKRLKCDFTIDDYYTLTTGERIGARLFIMEVPCH